MWFDIENSKKTTQHRELFDYIKVSYVIKKSRLRCFGVVDKKTLWTG